MSFLRLLENSGLGRKDILLEAMNLAQAKRVFAYHGVNTDGISPEDLKAAYRKLVKANHPDSEHGDVNAMKEINVAYELLKQGADGYDTISANHEGNETPPWAWAGYSGGQRPNAHIYRNNYTDQNYFKKRMWELSNHSRQQWTIYQFDGHFFRHQITVFGSPEIFNEMAEAMVMWGSHGGNPYATQAVLVQKDTGRSGGEASKSIYLIYANGHFYDDNPIEMQHDSFNANPANDFEFKRALEAKLQELRGQLPPPQQ